ncbi:MAG TPA: hypothetical protein VGK22_02365 [Candidatus Angelobacter sp.]|jgi:hypothetical protein
MQKRVSFRTASDLAQLLWPDFVEEDGCIFLAFQPHHSDSSNNSKESYGGKTYRESFVNHTHILDEFRNQATFAKRIEVSKNLDEVEETYNETHPDFIAACALGLKIAKMWAAKLKLDFPHDRFRVYYTQYDNPIVRFHKVRVDEPEMVER